MGELTDLLTRWASGDRAAFTALLPMVYDELHHLARLHMVGERDGHTLQPTALVNEAYLRLAGAEAGFKSRAHFFGAAATVMRRVLVDHARKRHAQKREAEVVSVADLDQLVAGPLDVRIDLEALDDALTELAMIAPEKAQVVELRYLGGLSVEETGEYLNLSPATVKRYWTFARAWLFDRLARSKSS